MTATTRPRSGKISTVSRLMIGTALASLAVGMAQAQTTNGQSVETVVVTGTSIRGTAPTGSNLITVDRATIETSGAQTVAQLLTNVPQISSNFGGAGLGGNGDFGGDFVPTIHNLGGGASAATLILIDGHRIPGSGLTVIDTDPSVIPASALERVEVLPDGASAVYGSDAVAGVINFITRKNYDGIEASAQTGFADHYSTFDASALWGHEWGTGSVMADFDYSSQSQLATSARSFLTSRADIVQGAANPANFTGISATPVVAAGAAPAMTTVPAASAGITVGPFAGATIPYPAAGSNSQNFNCPVASIAASSAASTAFYYPYNGAAVSTTTSGVPSQGLCDTNAYTVSLGSATRNNALIQVRQNLSDDVSFDLEAVYATRTTNTPQARGTLSATAFGPTAPAANIAAGQVNPFYQGNATTGTSSEFVRYDFNNLLGAGATQKTGQRSIFATAGLTWDLGNDREITVSGTAGQDYNTLSTVGVVSAGEAELALNGTTSTTGATAATGSQPDAFGTGSITTTTRVLNTSNALDVWDPAGSTNKTSAAVLAELKDGGMFQNADQGLQDIVAKFDGPVFDLPAGSVKLAVGAEFEHQTTVETGTKDLASGPASTNSQEYVIPLGRQIYSTFVEVIAPLVSPAMGVPLVEELQLDLSGRYDKFSALTGDTENPKVGINWKIVDGLKGRMTYGTSFVAPDIHHSGQAGTGFNSEAGVNALGTPTNNIIPFPGNGSTSFNGGAGVAGTWVATASTCAAGAGQPVNSAGVVVAGPTYTGAVACKVQFGAAQSAGTFTSAGLTIAGGNPALVPATGTSYSAGLDFDFGKWISPLDGLTTSVTYYDVKYHNLMTSVGTQNGIPQLTSFAPVGGWSSTSAVVQTAIAGKPLTIPLAPTIWAIFNGTFQNAYNVWQNGLDFEVHYNYRTDNWGNFNFGLQGNQILRASQQVVGPNPVVDVKDDQNSGRFPFIEFEGTGSIGWAMDAWTARLGVNFEHAYNAPSTAFPYNLPGPNRAANFYHVHPLETVDLNAGYLIPKGFLGLGDMATAGMQVSVTVQNILDTTPPLSPTGIADGSQIGRLVTVGVRKTF